MAVISKDNENKEKQIVKQEKKISELEQTIQKERDQILTIIGNNWK